VAKFNKATPFGYKVLAANTLHFKPIFYQFLKKIVKAVPFPMRGALLRLNYSPAPVKIWGRSRTPYGPKYGLLKNLLWVSKH